MAYRLRAGFAPMCRRVGLLFVTAMLPAALHADLIFSQNFETAIIGSAPPMSANQTARLEFMEDQLSWYLDQPYSNLNTWMYDRVQVLYEYYLRTGDQTAREEARRSALEYIQHYTDNGGEGYWPDCNGGWDHAGVNRCDAKFTHVAPLYYLEAVEGVVAYDSALLARLEAYSMASGWNGGNRPYDDPDIRWTERNVGLTLNNIVYLQRLGSPTAAQNLDDFIGWLYDHQQNPQFDPYTGAWMHSYNGHEGSGEPGDATDDRAFSPWMSAMIVGSLWRAYQIRPQDTRIPEMIVSFAQALEDYGYIDNPPRWTHGANPTNQIAWYMAIPWDTERQTDKMDSSGWHADMHLPELQCMTAAGYYFETDPVRKAAFLDRYNAIEPFYNAQMAQVSGPARLFGWQHSSNPSCEWFIEQG